jgi:hypothetical protein
MTASARKRPWYLVLALLGALALGSIGVWQGGGMMALYRDPVDTSQAGDGVADEADRAAVVARAQAFLQTLDAEKARGWPLAVATLILGGAVFTFAVRTIGGSTGSRSMLIQLVIALGAINGLTVVLLRDVFDANLQFMQAAEAARGRANPQESAWLDKLFRTLSSVGPALDFGLSTAATTFIVVALTRRRSRDLLDAGTEALGDS